MSDCLWPHELQHARLPCPSLSSRVRLNSCPLSQWCHPTISSVVPFSSCLQSFPASGSFPMSQFFASGWSFNFSIRPSSEYSGLISFRMDWFDLLVVQGTLKSLLQHHSSKASILWCSAFFTVQVSHLYMTIESLIRYLTTQDLTWCHFLRKPGWQSGACLDSSPSSVPPPSQLSSRWFPRQVSPSFLTALLIGVLPDSLPGSSFSLWPTVAVWLIPSMLSLLYSPTLTFIHDYWKNHSFD